MALLNINEIMRVASPRGQHFIPLKKKNGAQRKFLWILETILNDFQLYRQTFFKKSKLWPKFSKISEGTESAKYYQN